jgi:hypothetical protein
LLSVREVVDPELNPGITGTACAGTDKKIKNNI